MTIHSVVIQKLLSTNAQLGRRFAAHHFKIYTYGSRNSMAIIDSDKTLICMRNACDFIGNLARLNGRFLFVNTNSLCDEIIEQMTKRIGCVNDNSWRLGGFLTNRSSPKKFRSRNKKLHLSATDPPDCVVIMDTARKSSVIYEADKLQIPIVGLVDSSIPWDIYKRITYPVPANDSVQFVYLFCNLITKTFLAEQKRFGGKLGVPGDESIALQQSHSQSDSSEVTKQTEPSILNDETITTPYESLASTSDDPLETKSLLDTLVVLRLNGSLGTEMGFNGPKSSIKVRDGLTYLDLNVNQIKSLNSKYGCNIPLILMNNSRTHEDTLKVVENCSSGSLDINVLCQSRVRSSKNRRDSDKEMLDFDPYVLWHTLKSSGTLDALLIEGKEYMLVVKGDCTGLTIDSKILNHLTKNGIELCTELSDVAETPEDHAEEKPKFIDNGNLWINLSALERLGGNDSMDFEVAFIAGVPKADTQPLRKTSDLLLIQSDIYTYAEGELVCNRARSNPTIELGPEFEKLSDFESRFKSIPSIMELDSLKVKGDVWFGSGITLKGNVTIAANDGVKIEIPDGTVLENKEITNPIDL